MIHNDWCRFKDENDQEYGSFEVFQFNDVNEDGDVETNYYWWSCFPGCLPDGDPVGPFRTFEEAYEDAVEC